MTKKTQKQNLQKSQRKATAAPKGGLGTIAQIKRKRLRAGKEGDTLARLTLFFIFIALEVVLLIAVYIKFLAIFKWLVAIFYLFSIILACRVAAGHKGMDSKIAWIMFLLIFAPVSVIVYIAAGENGASPVKVRRLLRIYSRTNYLKKNCRRIYLPPSVRQICNYVQNSSNYPAYYDDGEVKYFPSGERFFDSLLREVDNARHFIFIEFFIINSGSLAQVFWEKLAHKHKQGVDVRIICDGLGSAEFMHSSDAKFLKKNGIKLAAFEPVLPVINLFVNYRDHRKLVVIDGHIAYTGGVNLADEYINQKLRFGHFKDAGVRVQGFSANSFTLMFLRMWHFATGKEPDYERILKIARKSAEKTKKENAAKAVQSQNVRDNAGGNIKLTANQNAEKSESVAAGNKSTERNAAVAVNKSTEKTAAGAVDNKNTKRSAAVAVDKSTERNAAKTAIDKGTKKAAGEKSSDSGVHAVIPYGDGPCEKSRLAKGIYIKAIENAKRQIYIMTPYFVADSELMQLLIRKALGGVNVRIIIPQIPDKKPVYVLTRHCAESLIAYGVKVYTYCDGFVHSKVLLCDEECAVVGSVNFDYRSFYQQYECGVYFTHKSALNGVIKDFLETFKVSTELSQKTKHNILWRTGVSVLKMFAPLM